MNSSASPTAAERLKALQEKLTARFVKFKDATVSFQVDPESGELRVPGGSRILPQQALELAAMLIEAYGPSATSNEVLTLRAALRQEVTNAEIFKNAAAAHAEYLRREAEDICIAYRDARPIIDLAKKIGFFVGHCEMMSGNDDRYEPTNGGHEL